MKKLRVHGTRPKGHPFPIISWGIRLFEWSDISHVVVELDDDRIYHAHFNEVRFEDLEEFKKTNSLLHTFEVEIPEENYQQMLDFCEGYAGEKEGYFAKLFGAFIPHMLRIFGLYVSNTFEQGMEGSSLCSELIRYLAVHYWNFKVDSRIHPENFSTKDVLRMMKENMPSDAAGKAGRL